MGQPSADQVVSLMAVLSTNINWRKAPVDAATVQAIIEEPVRAGSNFAKFLQRGGTICDGKHVQISRNEPDEYGYGFRFVEQDKRAVVLQDIDLTRVHIEFGFRWDVPDECNYPHHRRPTVYERYLRLKFGSKFKHLVRLDAKLAFAFQNIQSQAPQRWHQHGILIFPGTVLADGDKNIIFLALDVSAGFRWTTVQGSATSYYPFLVLETA